MAAADWITGGLAATTFGLVGLWYVKRYPAWAERWGLPVINNAGRVGTALERVQVIGCGLFVFYGAVLIVLGTARVLISFL